MNIISFKEEKKFLNILKEIFSLESIANYLYENKIGIIIILHHIKAKEWPWRGKELKNDPIFNVPFFWGISYAEDRKNIKILYDVHPCKSIPSQYNSYNINAKTTKLPIERNNYGILGGCARYFVKTNNRNYTVFEKIPLYCSVFGIPDDCFNPNFEETMIETIEKFKHLNLWCFEETEYISEKVLPIVDLNFMKGSFLPSKYYPFVESSSKFLRGIFSINDLSQLNSEPWYSYTYELIEDMNPFESADYYKYEEKAFYFLRKKLLFEIIRQCLLIFNRDRLKKFKVTGPLDLDLKNLEDYERDLNQIKQNIINRTKLDLDSFINQYQNSFDFNKFKKSRFLVLDIEYVHISYPAGNTMRAFNFPSIITNIIWGGVKKGFDVIINMFILPCHFCQKHCKLYKKKLIKFDCLEFAFDFYQKQIDIFSELLATYEGFKLYSYGKSDFFQLEQLTNFFTDSFEIEEFQRKNRIKTIRLTKISEDLAIKDKSLKYIEENLIKKKFPSWTRKIIKERINKRFLTQFKSKKWQDNYIKIIQACVDDSFSTLLLMIINKF